jgi:hypothetical protein
MTDTLITIQNLEMELSKLKAEFDTFRANCKMCGFVPTRTKEHKPNNHQRVVNRYIELTNREILEKGNPAMIAAIYKVQSKAVKPIVEQCGGDIDLAVRVVEKAARYYGEKGLDWSLYAVSRSCADFLSQCLKENYNGNSR